ncbi:HlyD family efflux transporter periplasmic adaptor subunit [Hydrogenophaga sp. NH-16]|jgi:HlyD family secretion protein|uniref:HlyD family secretion protein n=1 Tax=Hydrogenophaga sp. NH-16 TaxID=2184519 RepID=UPI000FDA46F1|nr:MULTISPECIES: HlyD family efflux transporter periplasmic adaptor subunit [Pseudomonadota]MBS0599151.1 HlyD family efflux transporter periplasmic adaptor subunit [Pseudomonadota bacterium]HNG82771.1 HlyD family efflux transporter periplasmic adaptor subunit [Burkholderiaceae bacterium]
MDNALKKKLITVGIAIALAAGAWYTWQKYKGGKDDGALLHGNGRIEATEVDVATKLAGRVDNILVSEGAFVKAGQVLATMQVQTLNAQLREAKAQRQQTLAAVASAQAQVVMRQSDKTAQLARMRQAEAEFDAAKRRLARSETLTKEGAASVQTLDDDRARTRSAEAAIASVQAQADSADAAVAAARMQVTSAQSQVQAIDATLERIQAEIDDSQLKAPRDGRVQFRLAQPSEVLGAGGKVLNLVDLSDVYMSFFLPETAAGRVALGSEVRIVLDAAPQFVIPAQVSFVASTAQFTPKTVETASERQKLMFRVKARIAPELLQKHLEQVKTGLPGEAWIKLDPHSEWPAKLQTRVAP